MNAHVLRTPEGHYTLAALDAFAWMLTPVWLLDPDAPGIVWANPAALELWGAPHLDALRARDVSAPDAATRLRLDRAMAEIRAGRSCAEPWTFYRDGQPLHVVANLTGVVLVDGRLGVLHEARPVAGEAAQPLTLRSVEALRHTPVVIAMFDADGHLLMQNAAAQQAFGVVPGHVPGQLAARCARPHDAARLLASVADGEHFCAELPLHTLDGPRWHRVKADAAVDPVSGARAVLVSAQDTHELHLARGELAASEARLRALLEGVAAVIWELELPSHRIGYVSPQIEQATGFPAAAWQDNAFWIARVHPDDRARVVAATHARLAPSDSTDGALEYRVVRADGDVVWWKDHYRVLRDADGRPTRVLGFTVDISERVAAEERLRVAQVVFDHAAEGIMATDADNRIRYVNPAFEAITGYRADEVLGRPPSLLRSGTHDAAFYAGMWSALHRDGSWSGELWNRRKNGERYAQHMTVSVVPGHVDSRMRYLALIADVTERKQQAEALRYQALHDALTGLPNRKLFHDRLVQNVRAARRDGRRFALIGLDLDGFKRVNDTLGHEAGDHLLIEVAGRLAACVRTTDTVCRMGGDEFNVLLREIETSRDAESVAAKLVASLATPFELDGHRVRIGASLGIAQFPDDGDDEEALLRHADTALYRVKQEGHGGYAFYTAAMGREARLRATLEAELREALRDDALQLALQPVIDLDDGSLRGAEALARWTRANGRAVSPGRFVAIAETSGLIQPLTEAVLSRALALLERWRAHLPADFRLSVNLSPVLFEHGEAACLPARLLAGRETLARHLSFEIPERALLTADDRVQAQLEALHASGAWIAIDGVGTGPAPLAGLRRAPVDELKIDRAVIDEAAADAVGRRLLDALLALGGALGLTVIAQGVETLAQADLLRARGCRYGQGFGLARPQSAESLFSRLTEEA